MAMHTLSPKVAAIAAEFAYISRKLSASAIADRVPEFLERDFDFDSGLINGISGTVVDRISSNQTGFALIGKGKPAGQYRGHHIITIRGTASMRDVVTDLHCGVTNGPNDKSCHAGFYHAYQSMERSLTIYFSKVNTTGPLKVHCVGHSLGGALANLVANFLRRRFSAEVSLYTFGAPRVGLKGYATDTEFSTEQIYRSINGSDPITMVPVWPFVHAGSEYCLDGACLINPLAHKVQRYIKNATPYTDFRQISHFGPALDPTPLRLTVNDRHHVQCTSLWEKRIFRALRTYLLDAGLGRFQLAISAGLTFYDVLAQQMAEVAKESEDLAEQQRGLLACMLSFAGKVSVKVKDLSYQFIRWVFQVTIDKLNQAALAALHMM